MSNFSTTIWLARHGEAHNPRELLYGRLPRVRLTPEGRRQAHALANFLAPRPLAAIYSSPMLRARRTAEAVLATRADVSRIRIDSDLQEVRNSWEGQPLRTLEEINYEIYGNPRSPDDESMQMIHDRMQRWLERVLRRHTGADVLGVSHGDPVLILAGALRGLPLVPERIFPRPYIATGCVYRLRFDAQGKCREVEFLVPHAQAAA
jgi:broad specificity phosphatase PhoE